MKKLYVTLVVLSLILVPVGGNSAIVQAQPTEYQGYPLNFQDLPTAFDSGNSLMQWGGDMIDLDILNSEHPDITGENVYVAVLDTGLKKNWRDYFPEERIVTEWGKSFVDYGVMNARQYTPNVVESSDFTGEHPHGTHVTSTIIGFSISGTNIQGVAPMANIIPVKVLNFYEGIGATFGTDFAVAAGIDYVTSLAMDNPDSRFVISMSLGAAAPISPVEKNSIDAAIDAGVIVVAAAGNEGTFGMSSPGSYAPVIGVGASGWAYVPQYRSGEWVVNNQITSSWWFNDVPEDNSAISYIAGFSSRENFTNPALGDQELDVVAPGSWIVGPYPVGPGQAHLPWWSQGSGNPGGQYFFVGGTSMATPHVSGVVALMLQVNPSLNQGQVESILRNSADFLPFAGSQLVFNIFTGQITTVSWGLDSLNAVGYGLLQADSALSMAMT